MNKTEAFKLFMQDDSGFYNHYYDFVDDLVRETMKENIRDLLNPDLGDEFETVDNSSSTLAAFCRVLQYYSTADDYSAFMKELQG